MPDEAVRLPQLTKMLAFRGQDQVDIENLLAANPVDVEYIRRQWQSVAELDDPRFVRFTELTRRFDHGA